MKRFGALSSQHDDQLEFRFEDRQVFCWRHGRTRRAGVGHSGFLCGCGRICAFRDSLLTGQTPHQEARQRRALKRWFSVGSSCMLSNSSSLLALNHRLANCSTPCRYLPAHGFFHSQGWRATQCSLEVTSAREKASVYWLAAHDRHL